MLKILEEPVPNTIFILSTTNRYQIPKTIVSRCQKFHIPQTSHQQTEKINEMIEDVNQKLTYVNSQTFENVIIRSLYFIQGLPFDQHIIKNILLIWKFELATIKSQLNKSERNFLEKIIEIIHNIKYNLNLKLQLLSVTLQLEEEVNDTPR